MNELTIPKDWWKNWRENIPKYWNINLHASFDYSPEWIFTTRCSKTKTGKLKAIPKEFYISRINLRFYEWTEKYNLFYGILSDRYGIHFMDEELEYYDIHPSSLTMEKKQELGKIIGEKCKQRGFEHLIFWGGSVLMSRPYFDMLKYSSLDCYLITKLPVLEVK